MDLNFSRYLPRQRHFWIYYDFKNQHGNSKDFILPFSISINRHGDSIFSNSLNGLSVTRPEKEVRHKLY